MAVMMLASAQNPCARDIHRQTQAGNRDGLGKVDRHRVEDAAHDFVADQNGDHCQDDRTGKSRQIAELAGSEREARIIGILAGVSVGERGQQQRTRMGAHVQAIRHKGDRAEQQTADNLDDHHGPAEPNDRPSLTFASFVSRTQEDVRMRERRGGAAEVAHG